MGSLIDHDVVIGEFSHINTGVIVKANCKVESYSKMLGKFNRASNLMKNIVLR
jgi:acyl-[acyl carrier protein]--UDP-N-acetylglucosamine O-acyltransferase